MRQRRRGLGKGTRLRAQAYHPTARAGASATRGSASNGNGPHRTARDRRLTGRPRAPRTRGRVGSRWIPRRTTAVAYMPSIIIPPSMLMPPSPPIPIPPATSQKLCDAMDVDVLDAGAQV
jgi:hypothetical protein